MSLADRFASIGLGNNSDDGSDYDNQEDQWIEVDENDINDPIEQWIMNNRFASILETVYQDCLRNLLTHRENQQHWLDEARLHRDQIIDWNIFDPTYDQYLKDFKRLDPDQQRFVETCVNCQANSVVFLTGPGGSGKSAALNVAKQRLRWKHIMDATVTKINNWNDLRHVYMLRDAILFYVRQLSTNTLDSNASGGSPSILVTSPTGIASIAIGGSTYHRALGMTRKYNETRETVGRYMQSRMTRPIPNCEMHYNRQCREIHPIYNGLQNNIKTIIIDEISMVSAFTMDLINDYLIQLCNSTTEGYGHNVRIRLMDEIQDMPPAAFGGIQIIVMGDLCQLEPVAQRGAAPMMRQPFYESNVIRNQVQFYPVLLRGNHRAANDPRWAALLQQVRMGTRNAGDIRILASRVNRQIPRAARNDIVDIVPRNDECDSMNAAKLNNLIRRVGPDAIYAYDINEYEMSDNPTIDEQNIFNAIDTILTGLHISRSLNVAVGSRVMVTKNLPVVTEVSFQEDVTCPITGRLGLIVNIERTRTDIKNGTRGTVCSVSSDTFWQTDDNQNIREDESGAYVPSIIRNPIVYVRLNADIGGGIVAIPYVDHKEIIWTEMPIPVEPNRRMTAYHEELSITPLINSLVINTLTNNTEEGIITNRTENMITITDANHNERRMRISTINQHWRFRHRRIAALSVPVFSYLPIRFAWAITIHRAQGLSLDYARVSPQTAYPNNDFLHGKFYVMISRLRSLNGLYITAEQRVNNHYNFIRNAISCRNSIQTFYRRMQQYVDTGSNGPFTNF